MNQPAGLSTYLTTEELAALIKYDVRTIRNRLKDSVLFEGVHYIRPFGGRKILFLREAIERDIGGAVSMAVDAGGGSKIAAPDASRPTSRRKSKDVDMIPMAGGGICHV